jgi:hypothetical protein
MAKKIFRVQGDSGPSITFRLENVDVTGWSAVANILREQGDPITLTGSVADGPNGDFDFPFAAGDLDTVGEHRVEFQLTDTVGGVQTHPQKESMFLIVREQLD